MDRTGTSNLERKCSGTSKEGFLFLDVGEWRKGPFAWYERRPRVNKQGIGAFIWNSVSALCLFFVFAILLGACIKLEEKLDFGPALPFSVPDYAVYALFIMCVANCAVLVIISRRKRGSLAVRIGVHDGLFEIVPKKGKTPVQVPMDRVKTIEVGRCAFGAARCRLTLVDSDGRRHTIEPLFDLSRLGAFSQFCQSTGIEYVPRKALSGVETLLWGTTLIFLCAMAVTLFLEHPLSTLMQLLFGCGIVYVSGRMAYKPAK